MEISEKKKFKYEVPVIVDLGEMAKAIAFCNVGSSAAVGVGDCNSGAIAATCTSTGTGIGHCQAGTLGSCYGGSGPT